MCIAKSLSSILNTRKRTFSKIIWKSISSYSEVCRWALIDEFVFSNFKRHPQYTAILEHVSPDQGADYIKEIKKSANIEFGRDAAMLSLNDLLGNPQIVDYGIDGKYSPTTLRYAKVASDLIDIFELKKDGPGISIVEIGVGYGGQCLILDKLLNVSTYTLIDISPALGLAKSYLERFVMSCKLNFVTLNEVDVLNADLCISNYAFSELNRDLQDMYIQKVVRGSNNGYMTYNHITDSSYNTYSADELLRVLPGRIQKYEERPLTSPNNIIVTWKS